MSNPIVTIEMENGDIMKAELYPEIAPNTVNNFISLVKKGFYDGVIFHRVINGFMIQGGDPDGTGMGIGMMILFFGLWSGGSVGRADGMILVVSGIFLGFEKNVEVFVMGLFLAGITSLFLSVIRRKGRTYRIPFAPFLLAGYLFVMVME